MGVIHGIIFAYSIYRVFAEQRNPGFPEGNQNAVLYNLFGFRNTYSDVFYTWHINSDAIFLVLGIRR
jgi:hypothetical protein